MDTRCVGTALSNDDIASIHELIEQRLEGGDIIRYHTAPQVGRNQTVGQHTWRGMVLLDTIWPGAPTHVWKYFLYHDIGELVTGDVPSPVKWANKTLSAQLNAMEEEYLEQMGLVIPEDLEDHERLLVEMIDVLELVLYCRPIRLAVPKAKEVHEAGIERIWKLSVALELLIKEAVQNPVSVSARKSLDIIRSMLSP
jgi:hypothetical protein